MNKIERVRAALAGQPVDRPPLTVWYHFGNQHAPAERTAQVHLEFFDHYDLDRPVSISRLVIVWRART